MRYKELIEDYSYDDPGDAEVLQSELDKMGNLIKRDCQPFLKEIKNQPLNFQMYRGMYPDIDNDKMGIKFSRLKDRRPHTSSYKDSADLNQFFTKHYGHPYRNGVFTSGWLNVVKDYGKPYQIFPIGNFEYIWHPDIYDLYGDILVPELSPRADANWLAFAWDNDIAIDMDKKRPVDVQEYHDFLDSTSITQMMEWQMQKEPYQTTGMTDALKEGNEIMVWTEKYYYVAVGLVSKINWK